MNELSVVFGTEIARRMRSRMYVLASLFGAAAIAFFIEAPALLSGVLSSQTDTIVLAGPAQLRARAEELLGNDYHVTARVDRLPASVTPAYLDAHGKAAAAVALSTPNGRLHVDVYARDLAAWSDAQFRNLAPLNFQLATGVSVDRSRNLLKVDRALHGVDTRFADTRSAELGHGIALGLVFMLYMSIILSSQAVMANVAEEKTSRIAELLVATISPVNLLAGKTLATATMALVQLAVWVGTAFLLFPHAVPTMSAASPAAASPLLAISPGEVIAFAAFFLIGFFQYATVYAAAGSLISRTEDLGSVSGLVVLPVIAAFLIAQFAVVTPNAPVVMTFSFVPFIAPFVMFARMAVATVPLWQIAVSLAINGATVVACAYVAGKVYRIGMLLYGKLPSLRQIAAALRA